jgi:hypothetical protein
MDMLERTDFLFDKKVRPVSIVSRSHYVNLARRRAQEFGKTTIVGQESQGSDVVVSTKETDKEVSKTGLDERRQRGFFADQFEVGLFI